MTDVGAYMRLDLEETSAGHMVGRAPAPPEFRAGAVLTMLDMVGGICGGLAALPDGWVVSTNLAARIVGAPDRSALRVDARVLRRGRNNVVTAVEMHNARNDALLADGVLTSAILVPEHGPPVWERPVRRRSDGPDVHSTLTEWLKTRAVGAHAVEIELTEELRNPWGILHGGVVASLADLAVAHASDAVCTDVVLHFLAPNRVGPVRADARRIGAGVWRVEIRDEGAARVTAVAIVTTRE